MDVRKKNLKMAITGLFRWGRGLGGCQRGQRFLYVLRHAKEREHILSKINPKGNDVIS